MSDIQDYNDFFDIDDNQYNFLYTIDNNNDNIFETIENMLYDLKNNTNIFQINGENDNTLQFNIEFEFTNPHNVCECDINYFKNCSQINEKLGKPIKIKKGDVLLSESCLICIEEYKINQFKRTLPLCQHTFHKKCIDKWIKKNSSCPICRSQLIK